jgi:hypothetical protein
MGQLKIYLTGQAKIVAVKTQKVLMVLPETAMLLSPDETEKMIKAQFYTPKELKDYCIEFFLKSTTEDFVDAIRSDVQVKRAVGGTKWVAQLRHEDVLDVHTSLEERKEYYQRYVAAKPEQRPSLENANLNRILDAMCWTKAA